MRILHLAYEDPKQPGSGGGSVRTLEVNRRLSRRHEITAVVAGYPGARERVEDGIRWIPIGPSRGGKVDRLSYFALAGPHVLKHRHDLVIEDFGAPFSIACSPLFTRHPVIGSVQWLFAAEMRRKYRLPFDLVERFGLRFYDRFIVVSEWLGQQIRERRPTAEVVVIPNGIEDLAYSVGAATPSHLLFVGRLDMQQKGLDMLVSITARAASILGSRMPKLVVVGDGPDRQILEKHAENLGVLPLIKFHGRVEGIRKYQLMANAFAVLMPSRFETFGMVAAESQAAGAPVVAFDIGPLAAVVGEGGACLVKPFDVDAFAANVAELVTNSKWANQLRASGKRWARQYNWGEIAARQEEYYVQVLQRHKDGVQLERGRL